MCWKTCKNKQLTISYWNVYRLVDNHLGSDIEKRMALVSRELEKYCIDIAALSETRLADHSQLQEVGVGYTFF